MKHWLTGIAVVLVVLVHAYLAWHTCDGIWLQRSGASVVAVGVLIEGWTLLTTPNAEDMPYWSTQDTHTLARAAVALLIMGSMLQGYADLLFSRALCR